MKLAGFDSDAFLRDIWQRKPLLIRHPWQAWTNPLEPDELAGLACESGVESRLVTGAAGAWTLEHGPLVESRFSELGAAPWTLLVQAVDHHVPDVAALIDPFRFVPNWRVDDVMVSYATDGGGVGPHFDQYDVFLIQGLGRRRWRVGPLCDHDAELLPHDELRLLAHFEATEEWVLDPGDILYVPPRYGHDGVAVGDDCMTYSVGFRAPSRAELIAGWTEHLADTLDDDDRYADPGLAAQGNPGEIAPDALTRLHAMVTDGLRDGDAFARWFGTYATRPKNSEIDWRPDEPVSLPDLREALARGAVLLRNPAARFSFIARAGDALLLFVNGESFACDGETADFAREICANDRTAVATINNRTLELIAALVNEGALAFED